MFGPEGQRRALNGLVNDGSGDLLQLHRRGHVLVQWPVDAGYPMLGDKDSVNMDRGERVITWRFTLPASMILSNSADQAIVVSMEGRTIVSESFASPVVKVPGQKLLVYVNEVLE